MFQLHFFLLLYLHQAATLLGQSLQPCKKISKNGQFKLIVPLVAKIVKLNQIMLNYDKMILSKQDIIGYISLKRGIPEVQNHGWFYNQRRSTVVMTKHETCLCVYAYGSLWKFANVILSCSLRTPSLKYIIFTCINYYISIKN